jgi:amino acid transporter
VAIAFAVLLVLPPAELAASDAPLAHVYQSVSGESPVIISAIALFAVVNGALIQIIMAARVCYGMARQNWLPALFGQVSPVTRTPVNGTVFITALVIVMALWLPLESLARATSFFLLTIFSLVNLSLLRIKSRTGQDQQAEFQVPRWVPALGFLTAVSLLLTESFRQLTG